MFGDRKHTRFKDIGTFKTSQIQRAPPSPPPTPQRILSSLRRYKYINIVLRVPLFLTNLRSYPSLFLLQLGPCLCQLQFQFQPLELILLLLHFLHLVVGTAFCLRGARPCRAVFPRTRWLDLLLLLLVCLCLRRNHRSLCPPLFLY